MESKTKPATNRLSFLGIFSRARKQPTPPPSVDAAPASGSSTAAAGVAESQPRDTSITSSHSGSSSSIELFGKASQPLSDGLNGLSKSPTLSESISSVLLESGVWDAEATDTLQTKPTVLTEASSSVKTYSLPTSQIKKPRPASTQLAAYKQAGDSLSIRSQSSNGSHNPAAVNATPTSPTMEMQVMLSRKWAAKAAERTSSDDANSESQGTNRRSLSIQSPSVVSSRIARTTSLSIQDSCSSEDDDSDGGTSSDDEKPLAQVAVKSVAMDDNAPLSQVSNHLRLFPQQLGRQSPTTVYSPMLPQPAPSNMTSLPRHQSAPVLLSHFNNAYTDSEAGSSETLTMNTPPASPGLSPQGKPTRTFKSFMSTIFSSSAANTAATTPTNSTPASPVKKQTPTTMPDIAAPPIASIDAPRVQRSSSAIGFRGSSPTVGARSSFPRLERSVSQLATPAGQERSNSAQAYAPSTVLHPQLLPLPLTSPRSPDLGRTGMRRTWSGGDYSTVSAYYAQQQQQHQQQNQHILQQHHQHLQQQAQEGRNSGSDYGGDNSRVWGGSDYGGAAQAWSGSEAGRSEVSHRSSVVMTAAGAAAGPLVYIEGVTSGPRPVSMSLVPPPPPSLARSFAPPPMSDETPPTDPGQLLEYVRYHQDMATKAFEVYQLQQAHMQKVNRSLSNGSSVSGSGKALSPLSGSGSTGSGSGSGGSGSGGLGSKSKSRNRHSRISAENSSSTTKPKAQKKKTKKKQVEESSGTESSDSEDTISETQNSYRKGTQDDLVHRAPSSASLSSLRAVPPSILRSASTASGSRVKKGVKFDETAAAGDNERGPMTKRRKSKKKAGVDAGAAAVETA
ncbi:hypothetical protein BDR26DRAFT_862008 [Obelidium mucronatum]|nr:hypothetical protein BDR26DRAFT_862008 [Obelidium mucronatum]